MKFVTCLRFMCLTKQCKSELCDMKNLFPFRNYTIPGSFLMQNVSISHLSHSVLTLCMVFRIVTWGKFKRGCFCHSALEIGR